MFSILGVARKTRIIDVVYNASNNELVRTKTLVKNAIVVIDATPFRQWFESHYALPIGRKKSGKLVSISMSSSVFVKLTNINYCFYGRPRPKKPFSIRNARKKPSRNIRNVKSWPKWTQVLRNSSTLLDC